MVTPSFGKLRGPQWVNCGACLLDLLLQRRPNTPLIQIFYPLASAGSHNFKSSESCALIYLFFFPAVQGLNRFVIVAETWHFSDDDM